MKKSLPGRLLLLTTLASLAMLVAACAASTAQQTPMPGLPYHIAGHVYEKDGVTPVQGATVRMVNLDDAVTNENYTKVTDDTGYYGVGFGHWNPGDRIEVTVTYKDVEMTQTVTVDTNLGSGRELDFDLDYSSAGPENDNMLYVVGAAAVLIAVVILFVFLRLRDEKQHDPSKAEPVDERPERKRQKKKGK